MYPVMFHRLITRLGYPWTMRSIGFVVLSLSIIPTIRTKMRFKADPSRDRLQLTAFKNPEFALFATAMFLGYLGLYIPFFYIQIYSSENSNITGELYFYLITIMNGAGLFGGLVSAVRNQ